MQNMFWLQPHECEDVLFFFVMYWFLRWNKQSEDEILDSEELKNKTKMKKINKSIIVDCSVVLSDQTDQSTKQHIVTLQHPDWTNIWCSAD